MVSLNVSEDLLRRLQSVQKKIRSHLSCVAWSSLVTSETKDNLQDRHFDALVLERFGNLLPGNWLYVISLMPSWRQLRSATSGQLYIPRTKTMTFGPRSFKVSSPTIWNDLPARLKDSSMSKNSFRKLLKTFLFDRWPCENLTSYNNSRGPLVMVYGGS